MVFVWSWFDTALALHSDLESWKAHQQSTRPRLGFVIGLGVGVRVDYCHATTLGNHCSTLTTIRSASMGQLTYSRLGGWDSFDQSAIVVQSMFFFLFFSGSRIPLDIRSVFFMVLNYIAG